MANRIIYTPPGIILSSSIGEIEVRTDDTYIDVSLTDTGGTKILAERYYACNGTVKLYDLSSLIEARMRDTGDTIADFRLSVYTDTPGNNADTRTLHILYCDRYCLCNDIPQFLRENFLTSHSMRRVSPDTGTHHALSLFLYAEKGESLEYTVHHRFLRKGNDNPVSHSFFMDSDRTAKSSGLYQIELPLETIIADAASFMTTPLDEITPLSFTLHCGQRSVSAFIDPALDSSQTFFYLNCFNLWESITFPLTTTAKTDTERSTAIINGKSEFYDRNVTKTYETQTGPLTSDEADCIDRLLTSYSVMRLEHNRFDEADPYILAPVLITESTCEISDSDDKTNTVKFTWRFADNRPILRLPASPGIFTEPYNLIFS